MFISFMIFYFTPCLDWLEISTLSGLSKSTTWDLDSEFVSISSSFHSKWRHKGVTFRRRELQGIGPIGGRSFSMFFSLSWRDIAAIVDLPANHHI